MKLFKRPPDMNIGPDYLHRWWVIPRNRYLNIYLHKILKDDDDRALHDHPWWSVSFLLKGKLLEVLPYNRFRRPKLMMPLFRSARMAHRLVVIRGPVWTLLITGPRIRDWGFHCPKGWVPWQQFVDQRDKGKVGRGCGEHD